MNDPHVVALIYRINHGDTIDYSKAERMERDEPGFSLTVEDSNARFEFKEHFSTEEQAREAIGNYIQIWEFDATLQYGNSDSFRLEFVKAEIIDRNPSPGHGRVTARLGIQGTGSVKLTVSVSKYPSPPSDIALSPTANNASAIHGLPPATRTASGDGVLLSFYEKPLTFTRNREPNRPRIP